MTMAALYARVSTDDQTTEQQRTALKEYCRRRGWKYRTFTDEGVSGAISDRPGWQKLLKGIEQGKFDVLVVLKTDRITRSGQYAYEFLEFYDKHDFKVVSLTDSVDLSSADGRFTFKLLCLLSERELDLIRERTRLAMQRPEVRAKCKGGKPGRRWKKRRTR